MSASYNRLRGRQCLVSSQHLLSPLLLTDLNPAQCGMCPVKNDFPAFLTARGVMHANQFWSKKGKMKPHRWNSQESFFFFLIHILPFAFCLAWKMYGGMPQGLVAILQA